MNTMTTSVELQEPLSFAVWPWVALAVALLGAVAFVLIRKLVAYMKKKKELERLAAEERKRNPVPVKPSLPELKDKYMQKIIALENQFLTGQIESREAYEELSNLFRTFIYDATGVPAHKFTLYDMRGFNNPIAYNLVNNYYAPEFSSDTKGNILESIDFTKRAVFEWN